MLSILLITYLWLDQQRFLIFLIWRESFCLSWGRLFRQLFRLKSISDLHLQLTFTPVKLFQFILIKLSITMVSKVSYKTCKTFTPILFFWKSKILFCFSLFFRLSWSLIWLLKFLVDFIWWIIFNFGNR